ncbi:MAG: hypothetical protein M1453_03160 [Acidobacteria bacterium]|nr:hypothetical protein [Acidobacteriota bacterium]MCL5286979.1 hypothetical protein [Acidobacteriota bacterium]
MATPSQPTEKAPTSPNYGELVLGLLLGLVPWGLSLVGMTTNIWLGGFILLAAFALVAHYFWHKTTKWRGRTRLSCVIVAALIWCIWVGFQMHKQYIAEHPAPLPGPVPSPEVKGGLKLDIRMLNAGQRNDRSTTAFFRVVAYVYNSGLPTIAEDWQFNIESRGSTTSTVVKYFPPGNIKLKPHNPKSPEAVFRPSDALYIKAAQPISSGGMIDGVIQFEAENFDTSKVDDDTIFVLSAADVWGKRWSAKTTLRELNARPPHLFPSSTPSDQKPAPPSSDFVPNNEPRMGKQHSQPGTKVELHGARVMVDTIVVGRDTRAKGFFLNVFRVNRGTLPAQGTVQYFALLVPEFPLTPKEEDAKMQHAVSKVKSLPFDYNNEIQPGDNSSFFSLPDMPNIQAELMTREYDNIVSGRKRLYVFVAMKYRDSALDTRRVRITEFCAWFSETFDLWHNCHGNRIYDVPE